MGLLERLASKGSYTELYVLQGERERRKREKSEERKGRKEGESNQKRRISASGDEKRRRKECGTRSGGGKTDHQMVKRVIN